MLTDMTVVLLGIIMLTVSNGKTEQVKHSPQAVSLLAKYPLSLSFLKEGQTTGLNRHKHLKACYCECKSVQWGINWSIDRASVLKPLPTCRDGLWCMQFHSSCLALVRCFPKCLCLHKLKKDSFQQFRPLYLIYRTTWHDIISSLLISLSEKWLCWLLTNARLRLAFECIRYRWRVPCHIHKGCRRIPGRLSSRNQQSRCMSLNFDCSICSVSVLAFPWGKKPLHGILDSNISLGFHCMEKWILRLNICPFAQEHRQLAQRHRGRKVMLVGFLSVINQKVEYILNMLKVNTSFWYSQKQFCSLHRAAIAKEELKHKSHATAATLLSQLEARTLIKTRR